MSVVDVRDVFCLYAVPAGSVAALRGLTLRVEQGEKVVLYGPNGSGKTTLLRVLMAEEPVSAGTARVAGIELGPASTDSSLRLRRSILGVIDQHSRCTLRPELSVLENVAVQLRVAGVRRAEARRRAAATLEGLGLADLAERPPATLSGGQAQRVAVCAALAHGPRLVLADEPTGELDRESADDVYELLVRAVARADASLLMVSHDRRAARVADRAVRIRDGRISESWEPARPDDVTLVVDDQGWVRLPESLRYEAGALEGVRADGGAAITLRGVQDPVSPVARHRPRHAVGPGEPRASLRGVRLGYGGVEVLRGVDLDVRAGELVAVQGPSGSGKTTLLRVLLGLTDPAAGSAELAGTPLAGCSRSARALLRGRYAATAGQSDGMADTLSVRRTLQLARRLRGKPADAERVADVADRLGLAALLERPVWSLSGGEMQRTAIARCLMADVDLIVLDEPSSQQDEAHAELVGAALQHVAMTGAAVVMATHDATLLAYADDRLVLG